MRPFEILAWDSAFFGVKIGRIRLESATPEALAEAIHQADREGVQCLYWLVDGADSLSPRAAAQFGFRVVDIRVTFEHNLRIRDGLHRALPAVRAFHPEDLPAILELARKSHRDSRFFYDGNFTVQQGEALFEEWLRKGCQGSSDAVFIAERDGRPAGYCVCSVPAGGVGLLTLIAVDPRCRRAQLGTALVASAITYFQAAGMRAARVVTQGRNIASQRLYERCGFVTDSVQLWYHRWTSDFPGQRP